MSPIKAQVSPKNGFIRKLKLQLKKCVNKRKGIPREANKIFLSINDHKLT